MPDRAARLERLEATFSLELDERIRTLSGLFAAVEQGQPAGALPAMLRALHSLKGAARAIDAQAIEQVAHAAETAAADALAAGQPSEECVAALRSALEALSRLQRDPRVDKAPKLVSPPAETAPTRPVERPRSDRPQAERADSGSVRVSLAKLDTLLTESGELAVTQLRIAQRLQELRGLQNSLERWQREWSRTRPARARIRRFTHGARESEALLRAADHAERQVNGLLHRTRELVSDLSQNAAQLATVSTAIGDEVMAIRLLPAGTVFGPLERLVRDLSRQTGKEARLELEGGDTEIDRRILDELRDPLMHMLRNSVDHGLETPDERRQVGKPGQGRLKLSAVQRGDRVHIELEDDGRGLDIEAIRATAIRRNVVTAERAESMDNDALIDLIFHAGFSTRTAVSELSGRGVGMDVVREAVARLGGDIRVRTQTGSGTTFTIAVPLTLATTRVLLIEDGGHTFAVPSSQIERTGRVRAADLHRLEGKLALRVDSRVVPVVELSGILQQPTPGDRSEHEWRPFFLLSQGERAVAVLTDRLIDETELVAKGLGAPLSRVRHVTGAAVLGTGALVVILNPADLFKSAQGNLENQTRAVTPAIALKPAAADAPRRRVLVVDDSVMTRTLERTILESAGYSVLVATDGAHALELLNAADVDAVVSDVEMPRMTGLELTTALRQDERWRHLPIVLVTSLDSAEHIERGAAAGADAYIVKGRFDQNDLLQAIGRLM